MGEGERLHAERRRRFWVLLGGLAALGAVVGFGSSFVDGNILAGREGAPWILNTISFGIVLIGLVAGWASWRFFESVDEVELADNLWGSLIGFYAYAFLFPGWWALWKIGRAPEPDDWTIFITSMVIAMIAYFVRKWRAR